MLSELRIRNVGVIHDATLRLGPGLNVLTGETGAGKTMVVSAVELLLGVRADADRVRSGADRAIIEASLAPVPSAAHAWLDAGDDELIVAREVAAGDGAGARSRARIGGHMAPVSALAECVGGVVELHGQADSSRLNSADVQRQLLDRFGGAALAEEAQSYRRSFEGWQRVEAEHGQLTTSAQDRFREADRLRYELNEIDEVNPQPGEDLRLTEDLARHEHAEGLLGAASSAASALADDGGAHDVLAGAAAALRGAGGIDAQLDALTQRVESLTAETQDVAMELRGYAEGLDVDPVGLESLRDRHAQLVRLSRKYGQPSPGGLDATGVFEYAERARTALSGLDSTDDRLTELAAELVRLEDALQADALRLREARTTAAKRLEAAVSQHLADLAMAQARLEVVIEPTAPTDHGADRIAFQLAANPGEPPLPLAKAASGGERSRVALALRVALADADETPVLVFDEVDAGIGGATALAVGRKLARLAQGRQVICVTHLAQLAAHADVHFRVHKAVADDRTSAQVAILDDDGRVTELSRMLSGTPDSAVAADHAAELLAGAQAEHICD